MRWTAFFVIVGGCLLLAGCGGDGGSPAPVAGGAPSPGGSPGMPGDGASPEGMPPSDGGTPPNDGGAPSSDGAQGTQPGDDYTPPNDGLAGAYDGGAESPGYNPDGTPMTPLRPRVKSLREQAIDAFRAGNEKEAFRLLRTHMAISPSAQADVAEKMAWVTVMRRPAIGPRIGIAAHYVLPVGDFTGSPQPIGSPELQAALGAVAQAARGGQRAGGGEVSDPAGGYDGAANAAGDATKAAEGQLAFFAGEFGTKFLTALQSKIDSGEYGAIYKDLVEEVARPPQAFDPNNPGDPNQTLDGQYNPPNPGDGGIDPNAEGAGTAGPGRLGMAVTWLGKADKKQDLTKLALDAGVDVLVTYEIALKPTRVANLINNLTRLKITDLKKPDPPLFTSPALDSRVVTQDREKGQKDEDPVDREVARALEALDKVCKPAPLPPGVSSERVKVRIAELIAEKPADPLPVLLETRFYVAKGLLTESDMQSTAVSLLGEIEYAQLIASSPDGAMTQAVGSALGLPGMIDLLLGVNGVTGASARAKARKLRDEANPGEGQPPRARGWRDFLPVGGGQKK